MKWWRRVRREEEFEAELQAHLAIDIRQRVERGQSPEWARLEALRAIRSVDFVKEQTRSAWPWVWSEQLLQDLRYAFRAMRANKTFTILAILSLALGIGANTAMFSFMDAILVRSLPVSHPEALVQLAWHTRTAEQSGSDMHNDTEYDPASPQAGMTMGVFAYPAFEMFQKDRALFSSVFGYQGARDLRFSVKGEADSVSGEYVSGEYFDGLGVAPAAGRMIIPDDDRAGAAAVAVVSYAWSVAHFGSPQAATGQAATVAGVPFTIIGVTPPEFFGADPAVAPTLFLPMHATLLLKPRWIPAAWYTSPQYDWVDVMARLRPGVSMAQVQAALSTEYNQWQTAVAGSRSRKEIARLIVKDGRSGLDSLRRQYSKSLYFLLTIVGLILTLACANIANLLLARAASRRRELSIRLNMGAGRRRVIRQLLSESLLLAGISGPIGLVFSVWGVRALTALLANGRQNFTLHAELNWHVLVVTAVLSLGTGVLFGLAPAIQCTKGDLNAALKETGVVGKRPRRLPIGWSQALILAQISIAALILIVTGLFLRTVSTLESTQIGFNHANVLTFRVDAAQAGYRPEQTAAFYNNLQEHLRGVPGVRGVTESALPLIGLGTSASPSRVDGAAEKDSRLLPVGADFFSTMEIPILRGRAIDEHDQAGTPYVAVVNEAFATINAGDPNPLGHHIVIPRDCAACDIQIVGVAADAHYGGLTGPVRPTIFLPFTQGIFVSPVGMTYEIRTVGNPSAIGSSIRDVVRQIDPQLPITDMKTQEEWIDETINSQIVFARLCTIFAVLALTIAVVGLYATMSYKVARQTNEIGIRMALGAERGRVIWMVLREAVLLVAISLAIAIPLSLTLAKLIVSFLYGVKTSDPATLCLAGGTLFITAVLAAYLPARKAARIDPMLALRHE